MRSTPAAASAATPASTFGSACFSPSSTTNAPGARSSSAACSASRWASVSRASGEMPPIAS